MSEKWMLFLRLPRELRTWKSRVQMPKQIFKRAKRSQSARRSQNLFEQTLGDLLMTWRIAGPPLAERCRSWPLQNQVKDCIASWYGCLWTLRDCSSGKAGVPNWCWFLLL